MLNTKTALTKDDKRRILDNNRLPYDPQLAAVINETEAAVIARLAPDMFWDASSPEELGESIHNVLVAADAREGSIVEIQRAVSLENITVKVTAYDEEKNEYTYDEIRDS